LTSQTAGAIRRFFCCAIAAIDPLKAIAAAIENGEKAVNHWRLIHPSPFIVQRMLICMAGAYYLHYTNV
jgi:hypothetical protein